MTLYAHLHLTLKNSGLGALLLWRCKTATILLRYQMCE